MNTSRPARALVIGGGIAGPAVALFLKRAGLEPLVFEAYPRADDVGGSFQIAPNGARVLAELDLADALVGAGQASRAFCFRNHHGRVIGTARTDRSGVAINVARPVLQRLLRDALEHEGIRVVYEKPLREVTTAGAEAIATFEDGSTEVGDLLVGADGVNSRVRACILPGAASPRYTGMVAIGGFCPPGFAPPPELADPEQLTFMVGSRHQFGYGKFGSSLWAWWCHALAESDAERAALVTMPREALRAQMAARYDGWSAPTSEFIAATDAWLTTPIFDVPKLPAWHRGRVILLGDAAHAMSPAGGQGTSMALGDARVLGHLLSGGKSGVEEAFARFEDARRSPAEAFVKQAYANDRRTLKALGPVGMWVRDRMLMPVVTSFIERVLEKHYAAALDA